MPRKIRGKTSKETVQSARVLRAQETQAEKILWQALRDRRLGGIKFRRQHPIDRFVLDFYCVNRQVAIELDGEVHENPRQREYDIERSRFLNDRGIRVLRIKNSEVENQLQKTLAKILEHLELPHPPPSVAKAPDSPSLSWANAQEREGAGGRVRSGKENFSMKVLFIGGTGIISSACTELALERGIDLYLLNRGGTTKRGPLPQGVKVLKGDIRDKASARAALGDHQFDAVAEFIAFTTDHIEMDLDLLRGRTRQYIFISSASAYQTPPAGLPVTESTVLDNPFWEYSRNKIGCEEHLIRAYREEKFPVTIVRPSHTYDKTLLPFDGGYTVVDRMRKGKPVIVLGDGTSLWTLTHHRDFARAFVGLLGNPHAIGEDFHITNDEWLPWNQIYKLVAEAAGVSNPRLVHIPSELIAAYDPDWGAGLLGDKSHSMIFDNSKVKRAVPGWVATIPFAQGVREIMAWYDEDPSRQVVNQEIDAMMDRIIEAYQRAWPKT